MFNKIILNLIFYSSCINVLHLHWIGEYFRFCFRQNLQVFLHHFTVKLHAIRWHVRLYECSNFAAYFYQLRFTLLEHRR